MAGRVEFTASRIAPPKRQRARVLPVPMPETEASAAGEKLLSDSTILRISTALQSSLYAEDVIRNFATEIRRLLPKVSLRYVNKPAEVRVDDGVRHLHSCSYELNLVGDSLGELSFSRQRLFSEKEQALLELVLCALIYPLRNALLYQQALEQALKDPLTGVNNRASLDAYIKQQVMVSERHGHPLSVIMIDIDRFKTINDTYGHLVGDIVLRKVANGIVQCTRDSDVVFRFGGEEFVVVLSNTDCRGAIYLAERIRAFIEALDLESLGGPGSVTVSAGVTEYGPDDAPGDLLSRSDELLYDAKNSGRNRVESDEGVKHNEQSPRD